MAAGGQGYAGARDYLERLYAAGVVPEGTVRAIIVADIRDAFVTVYTQAVADGNLLDVRLYPLHVVKLDAPPADSEATAGDDGAPPAVQRQDAAP